MDTIPDPKTKQLVDVEYLPPVQRAELERLWGEKGGSEDPPKKR
jgi:hypothetical protein